MNVDYNNISKEFAKSRKNMKWEELQYFFEKYVDMSEKKSILDIGCGSGRLLEQFQEVFPGTNYDYLGVDLSSGMIEEAQKNFPEKSFQVLDMLQIDTLLKTQQYLTPSPSPSEERGIGKFDYIFLIASYHHLDTLEKREEVMNKLYTILNNGGIICFTNWSLKSEVHKEKYKDSEVEDSENQFGSTDFMIKFGEYNRYYHCFTTSELEYISQKVNFEIVENREFDNKKNIITVLKKPPA